MKRLALLVALVVFASQAQTVTAFEKADEKAYGNCSTSTRVETTFRNRTRESYYISCSEFIRSTDPYTHDELTTISISSDGGWGGSLSITASTSPAPDPGLDDVYVKIRVDNGGVTRETPDYYLLRSNMAVIHYFAIGVLLLYQLSRGERVFIKVASKTGSIRLEGAREAITDFRRRAGLLSIR